MAGSFGMGMGMEIPGMYGMGTEFPAVFAMGMEGIPLVDIDDPSDVDVLCGRGGASLKHPGNLTYRRLVHMNKGYYISCLKTEKLRISQSIVAAIREQRGRFLERDGNKGTWYDIGDKKAIEKTSQALREGQPKLRQQIVEMGVGQPCMGMEYKMTPGFMPIPMVTPALGMSPAAIQQQIAQQQLAQQRLLAQQRIIQQQMAEQQFAQQQARDQMVRQQLLAQRGVQANMMTTPMPPREESHAVAVNNGDGNDIGTSIMEQKSLVKDDPDGGSYDQFGGESQQRPSTSVANDAVDAMENGELSTSANFLSRRSGNHVQQFQEIITQDTVGLLSPLREFEGSYSSFPPLEMHTSMTSVAGIKHLGESLSPLPSADVEDSSRASDAFSVNMGRADRPPLYQSDVQQPPLSHQTDTNSSVMRIMDRRRIFAKMKYSRPPSFGKNTNRSSASLGVDDGMPDIHMVGSTFSLLSNISSNQDMKSDDMNISSRSVQKLRDDHMVLGSRRSLMSGLSKISDSTDAHSMFSDLSRRFANISTQSIPTSEISGVEEGNQEDLDESLHVDPLAIAQAVHMPFNS